MKRALRNLKYAITENTWVANSYTLKDLYSTICHIDSFEHYKVTKDPRNLFDSVADWGKPCSSLLHVTQTSEK